MAWVTVALQGLTSVKTHHLPPLCISSVYPVIYHYEDLPSYLMADYFLSYPSGEGYFLKPLETI